MILLLTLGLSVLIEGKAGQPPSHCGQGPHCAGLEQWRVRVSPASSGSRCETYQEAELPPTPLAFSSQAQPPLRRSSEQSSYGIALGQTLGALAIGEGSKVSASNQMAKQLDSIYQIELA